MNSTRNTTLFHYSTTEIAVGAVILIILMLGSFIGNLLTSLIFWRRPQLRTPTNISILFLAISDVLMAGLVMPFSLASLIQGRWPFSSQACTSNAFLILVLVGDSLITMTCTAVIRYLCVVRPALHQRYVKPKCVAIGISVSWLGCPIVQALIIFVTSTQGIFDKRRAFCIYEYNVKVVVIIVNAVTLAFAFMLGLMIFMAYFKVFRFVSHHNNTVSSNLQQGNTLKREAKITKTLVLVVLGFVSLWVPVTLIQVIDAIRFTHFLQLKMPNSAFLLQTICIFASSFINPFIFGFTNKRFRKEYFELLRVLCPSGTRVSPARDNS